MYGVELYCGQRFVVSIVFELRTEVVSIYGTEGWSVLYCAPPLPLWAHLLPKLYMHAIIRPPAKVASHSFIHMTGGQEPTERSHVFGLGISGALKPEGCRHCYHE